MATPVSRLSEIGGLYGGFILDLWGVVHDGVKPFPDTLETLAQLKKAKRRVWLLSNAPRRAWTVAEKLSGMGIKEDMYDGLLTSGEAAWEGLRDKYLQKWGRRCYHLGPARDTNLYDGLDVEVVSTPADADFVLNSGVLDFADPAEKYEPILKACAEQNLPMLCANPDRFVHVEEKLVVCAGTLADMYEQMDGQATWFGKPHRGVYSHILKEMGGAKVLAVGDSMVTDIMGAAGAGIDSVLVTSGLHREELADPMNLQSFLGRYPCRPTYIAERFCW